MKNSRSDSSKRHPFGKAQLIFEGQIQSRLEEREALIEALLGKLKESGCRIDEFIDRLSFDEAIANAILHGNQSDAAKKVLVRAYAAPGRWGVEVENEGPGFDWEAARKRALANKDLESSSGRGLTLILASGADVQFLDHGRKLLIVREP